MVKEIKYLAIGIFTIGLLAACKKEKTSPVEESATPTPSNPVFNNANVQALIANLASPVETYTIDVANGDSHTCANGTKIDIYPNAFLTQSGGTVTGVVTIKAKDVLSKKDMILNNAVPVSNGQLLVSGGEVYLTASQNNQPLKINLASTVAFYVPAGNSPSNQMKQFYANDPSSVPTTDLNWLAANTVTPNIPALQDTSIVGPNGPYYSYYFNCDSLNWSNCDYYYNLPGTKTTCTVNTSGTFDNSNTTVFLSMNGQTVLTRLNSTSYTSLSNTFVSYQNSIPQGSNYTIVAISFDGTNYYYASQAVTMTANLVVSMPALTLTTLAQIKTNLAGLP